MDIGPDALDKELETFLKCDDSAAADQMLAAGRPIHVTREDTPNGHVIRIEPDGSEHLVRLDRKAIVTLLGA